MDTSKFDHCSCSICPLMFLLVCRPENQDSIIAHAGFVLLCFCLCVVQRSRTVNNAAGKFEKAFRQFESTSVYKEGLSPACVQATLFIKKSPYPAFT